MSEIGDFKREEMRREMEYQDKLWKPTNRVNRTETAFLWGACVIAIITILFVASIIASEALK